MEQSDNIISKNINKVIAITDIKNFKTQNEVSNFCNKLIENLDPFGKVIDIYYYGENGNDKSYAVLYFKTEEEVNEVRKAIKLYPLFGENSIKIDKEKTIRQIRPTCIYIDSQDKLKSNVLKISNIPNDVEATDENLIKMFGGYGEILFLDKHIEENDTITAYAYYKNNEIARKTIDKMNGGTIKDNKINIELITPIPSCLWIGNIDFQKIDIDELIDKLKNFGEIKTLEIYDENNCLYINYMEVDNAVKLKKEIPYILNNAVIEFCIPVANDYKRELYGKNRLINENNNTTINNSLSLDNIENDNENDKYNKSAKRVKIDETQVKENNDSNEVKNESSKSRKIRNKRNRYQGSQAFWSTSVSVKNDSQVKIEDIKLDTEKKVDTSNNEEDKKKDISLKKENNIDKKPVILDEPKPINKMKLALRSWKIKIKTVVSYKGNKINMIVHYIDGDKDKFNEVFGNNNSIKFEKPIEPNENLLKKIKERIGIYRDPSWSVCIGYVDDEGDYTEKMKSDFERIEKVNNKLSRKHHINMMEIPNKKKTIVVLLPSDSYFDYMFEDIFVKESREEKVIMDGFGKFQFFAFIVFDSKVE